MKKILAFLTCALLLAACGPKKQTPVPIVKTRPFPRPEIPGMISDVQQRQDYVTSHFWDAFFLGEGVSDSSNILGVRNEEVEQNLSVYISLLNLEPVDKAQTKIASFFKALESRQAKDEKSLLYLKMTDLVVKYLYDPNSPLRSEDLYLPFVEGMVSSPYTLPEKLQAYRFELEKCRVNPYGSVAPDFSFRDVRGRRGRLHAVKGEYTMLFFSNPGCETCLEIINSIQSKPYIEPLLSDGTLAIVNVYIDYDEDHWKSYAPSYPESWVNVYDYEHAVNEEGLYFVRAIPSLYLLDKDKKILFKDVPVERALAYLEETLKIQ